MREKRGSDLHVHVHVGRHHLDTAGRMERLISALKSVLDKKHDLQTVVSALENLAPTSQERKTAESKHRYGVHAGQWLPTRVTQS